MHVAEGHTPLCRIIRMSLKQQSALFLIAAALSIPASAQNKPLYLDARQPVEKRVEDLLRRMTLEEKVGQMNMPCVYRAEMGGGRNEHGRGRGTLR